MHFTGTGMSAANVSVTGNQFQQARRLVQRQRSCVVAARAAGRLDSARPGFPSDRTGTFSAIWVPQRLTRLDLRDAKGACSFASDLPLRAEPGRRYHLGPGRRKRSQNRSLVPLPRRHLGQRLAQLFPTLGHVLQAHFFEAPPRCNLEFVSGEGCQEKSSASTGGEISFSRSSPL